MTSIVNLAALLVVALGQATPPDAVAVVDKARSQAKKEGKNVMVVFHASWCGWCKKFDKMLEDPKLKPSFEKSYVIVHLDVMENGDKTALENPRGADVMKKLGGDGAGLPFFAVIAPDGKKLIDSLRVPGDAKTNTGHPAAPEEIAHFITILKKTAPKMNEKVRAEIESYAKADSAHR